ncbi:MAG: Rrf2 family transcriptional regulator, partial [Ruminiclostridium sp.]
MMISTRGRYALRVLIDLAEHNDGKYIPMRDVA